MEITKTYVLNWFALIALTFLPIKVIAQPTASISSTEKEDLKDAGYTINTKVFKFGASLGFNFLTEKIYVPVLSAIDKSLRMERVNPASFLLSICILINPIKGYYRKLDSGDNPIGDVYTDKQILLIWF